MKIEYFHALKYGNGALVSEEFEKQMAAKGVTVTVHHIRDARPKETPPADHRSFFGRELFRLEKGNKPAEFILGAVLLFYSLGNLGTVLPHFGFIAAMLQLFGPVTEPGLHKPEDASKFL